jgi:NTE family protein
MSRLMPHGENHPPVPGTFDLLAQAMDLMQANLSRLRLAAYEPDLLIQLPRNMASVYEFYRARELIEQGREQTRTALVNWPRSGTPQRDG